MTADAKFDWIRDDRLQAVFTALCSEGEARLVGGCVRDTLLGLLPLEEEGIDIDIATTLTPEEMSQVFGRAGIRWVATGVAHGTITAVMSGLVCECTSLRSDVETDGRHAEVAFTRDWDLDWQRRDFTINALYADREGEVWDPAGGIEDLEARRVRFIGDPKERIREDALRILRFFRFSARFGERFDEEAIAAISEATDLLDRLSKERIWSEFSRTLPAKGAPAALKAANGIGVLTHIVRAQADLETFTHAHLPADISPELGLVALWPDLTSETLRTAFKPPTDLIKAYRALDEAVVSLKVGASAVTMLYRFGRQVSVEALRLANARGLAFDPALPEAIARTEVPILPLSGRDLVAGGIPPGEKIGLILKRFESVWLDAGAPTDDDAVAALLTDVLSS